MNMPNYLGLLGAIIAGYAYLPQVRHLITMKCSAGISQRAFGLWMVSSVLVTINAIYIRSVVFIVLGVIQIFSTTIIFLYSTKYKNLVCEFHAHKV